MLVTALIFAGAALVGASLMVASGALPLDEAYRAVDLDTIMLLLGMMIVVATLLFAGLFIVVAAMEKVAVTPAVPVLKPFVQHLSDPRTAWLALAMAATLAGNLTISGSAANLIVVQRARRHGIEIGFWTYFKIGAPVTALTIVIGVMLLG